MSDIFLSYKSEDSEKAQKIAKAIEKKGYTVWWDRIIPPGRNFDDVIEEELESASCVVVLWSRESVTSEWVRLEAHNGKKRKILVPILIEDVTPPFAFQLTEAAKLMDWDGLSHHHEFNLLMQSMGRILGRPEPMDSRRSEQKGKEEKVKKEQEEQVRLEGEDSTWEKTVTNSIGMKFALIPAGKFSMGSLPDEEGNYDGEGPVHEVTIRKPFYLGIYPVTQQEWQAVMGENPSYFNGDKLPVEQVSWDDVQNFIQKINKKEGTTTCRLPSEAEWEYAARVGTTTRYSFGDDESELDEYGWYDENSNDKTHPVGQKKSNSWGLYDMHGNVWEWVQDEYHDSYDSAPEDGSAWEDGSGALRLNRGGSWSSFDWCCQSGLSSSSRPSFSYRDLGFRLLQEL
jgi:formylglycine-generating enzyme required for sulfatase activity